jgi:hypothetical protein
MMPVYPMIPLQPRNEFNNGGTVEVGLVTMLDPTPAGRTYLELPEETHEGISRVRNSGSRACSRPLR